MGKGILVTGIVLGVLGILWSAVNFFLVTLIVAFGGSGSFLAIPVLSLLLGIASIVGGILGNRRTKVGAAILLGAGAAFIVAALAILYTAAEVALTDMLLASLILGWWAYGLVIAGVVAILQERSRV